MSIQITIDRVDIQSENRWNKLLLEARNSSYRASMSYEYAKKSVNKKIETFIFREGNEDIAGVHYILNSSTLNLLRTADIVSGIIFKVEPEKEFLKFIIQHFIQWAKEKKASYLRYNPWLQKTTSGDKSVYVDLFESVCKYFELNPIISGQHTYWINLLAKEDEILLRMKGKTRYRVRLGLKSNLTVNIVDSLNKNILNDFWLLYNKLGNQKGFDTLPESRFKKELGSLLKQRLGAIFITEYEGVPVNYTFLSTFGKAAYMYGAINPDYKKLKGCPSPGQISQWEMMKYAKKKGLETYDLNFCPGPVPQEEHPKFNVWTFKYGFGGVHVEYMPTYGKILKPIRGKLFQKLRYRK